MSLPSGTQLGPYEILAPLGAGGMGEVYRARDTRLRRDVALKILPADVSEHVGRKQRFEQEARAASALNHPNIVSVHDIGTDNGIAFIVTELVDGESLRAVIRQGPTPVRKLLDIAVQVPDGLAAAHAAGIVHRDLKPENIMLTRQGRVKILDFGLAKQSDPQAAAGTDALTLTEPGTVMGSVGYMSPEQVRGHIVDSRSDIFSFGLILYELAAGKRAVTGESRVEVMNAILKEDPPELPATAPTGLRQIVTHCLEKEPARRFQSAQDLCFGLQAISGDSQSRGLLPQAKTRRKLGLAPILIVTTLLVAAAGLGAWYGFRYNRAGGLVRRDARRPIVGLGPVDLARRAHSGFKAMVDQVEQVAVMKPESGDWTVLTHDRRGSTVKGIAWSRDGTKLYYDRTSDTPQGIFSIPVLGGEETLVLEDAADPVLLADGSFVVIRINSQRLWQLHRFWADTGRVQPLPAYLDSPIKRVRGSPDGKDLLFYGKLLEQQTKHILQSRLYVMEVATGRAHSLATQWQNSNGPFAGAFSSDSKSVYLDIVSGDLHRIVSVPRDGNGSSRDLFTVSARATHMDSASDGSVYVSLDYEQMELLRLPVSGAPVESVALSPSFQHGGMTVLPDGRVVLTSMLGGRRRLVVVQSGKDAAPLLDTLEETAAPVTTAGEKEIAFMIGPASGRAIAIAGIGDRRIRRRLLRATGDIVSLASSPDGKTLYYSASGAVWAIPATDGEPRKVCAGDTVVVDPETGDLIVKLDEKGAFRLMRKPADGGPEQPIPIHSGLRLPFGNFAPNAIGKDRSILLNVNPGDSWFYNVVQLDPKNGQVKRIPLDHPGDMFYPGWTPDGRVVVLAELHNPTIWRFRPEGLHIR